MTAIRFVRNVFLASLLIAGVLVAVNWFIDLYGLFRDTSDRKISIYSDERTSKYLLAHRYVPDNFDGYILGPSLSANVDPQQITGKKIYNLSMMGANITEQSAVVHKALQRKMPSVVVICLHPYLTLDHGMKTGMINEREYYGALGSVSLYKAYALYIVRSFNLAPVKYPRGQFNEYGYNDYGVTLVTMPVEDKIAEQLTREDAIRTEIDSVAFNEFNSLITELQSNSVRIVTYFHPLPFPLYDKFRVKLEAYESTMRAALEGKATIIDFNEPQYETFTKDLSNYIDHGHLSHKGQAFIMKEIEEKGRLAE